MPTFIGFNTVGQNKRFTLTDFELIKRDILNGLSIRQGELPGKPSYGTTIWDLLFESQTEETMTLIKNEIQRVIAQEPRVTLVNIATYPGETGVLVELELDTNGDYPATSLAIFFDQNTRQASYS